MVAVSKGNSGPFVLPSAASVNNLEYPIARDLYMYTAGEPSGAVLEYLDWIRANDAQEIVTELGFVPITQ